MEGLGLPGFREEIRMEKVQLTPIQLLKYIIIGIKNGNYQAVIDIAQDAINELEEREDT